MRPFQLHEPSAFVAGQVKHLVNVVGWLCVATGRHGSGVNPIMNMIERPHRRGIFMGAPVLLFEDGSFCASNWFAHLWITLWLSLTVVVTSDGPGWVVLEFTKWPGYPTALWKWLWEKPHSD